MRGSRSCFIVFTVFGWLVALAAPAHADTERFAVVIGNNSGAADEQQLRYAESDAQRIADVLSDLGGVPSENQVVLRGKTSDEVRSAIIAMNERIRVAARSMTDSVLFVYYSGHGDADALHLGSSRLPLEELELLVRGSPAGVRLLIGASVPLWGRSYLITELAEQIFAMAHSAGASPFTMLTFHLMGGIWL